MDNDIFEYCRNGDLEGVKRIIEDHSVNPEIRDKYGSTPLHFASSKGHIKIVKYLIEEAKVDPEIRDEYGNTPLHYVSSNDYFEIIRYLVEEVGVNPEPQNIYGNIPLHYASVNDYFEIVKYFIEQDIHTSIKNNDGETFLDLLKGENREEIERMLEDLEERKFNIKSRK